jgi:5-methylcytosine-specific restriction endonuclease McrA
MTIFWDVAPRSLVEVDQSFRGAYCLYHQVDHRHSDDGGSKHLWNADELLPGKVQNPKSVIFKLARRKNLESHFNW